MKSIYLLRHAHAVQGQPDQSDHDRPLSERGVRECAAMGRLLTAEGFYVDAVLCSTARRTRETLERVCAAMSRLPAPPQFTSKLYLASPGDLLSLLHALPESQARVLLIGHNPGFHEISLLLNRQATPASEDMELGFIPCGLAELSFEGAWSELAPGTANLNRYLQGAAGA